MIKFVSIVAFCLALLTPSLCAQQNYEPHGAWLRASVRPNDPLKFDAGLPWVSDYAQPAEYAQWWKEIAACEKLILPGELTKAVRFVQINAKTFRRGSMPEELYGYTDAAYLTIYLAAGKMHDASTVMHEMVHQLDFWNGFNAGMDYHPPDQFEACEISTYGPPNP